MQHADIALGMLYDLIKRRIEIYLVAGAQRAPPDQ